ncbi:NHL repeat-containing protein [Mucilaginibacter sp.]|uniref:NHL repeat-containing protein n=1 Tax=Mucilaginibacter sp. TaxID=1882438 RepID=UPI00326604D0
MKKLSTLCNFLIVILIAALSACSKSSDTAVTPPELVTAPVIVDAAGTTALTGGFITSGSATAYGVCYSTSHPQPTLSDLNTSETVAYSSFSSNITALTPNTTYYLRAYATYAGATAYGNVIQFSTGADLSGTSGTVSTFAGEVAGGFLDGSGAAALFGNPMGIATDAAGNIYVADSFNSAIRKIGTDGKVTTIAGNGNLGLVNGTAEVAQFYSPSALAVDATGNVYVADRGNNAIRKITPAGVVTTFAGNGEAGYTDGTGSAAYFNTPTGIAVDAAGNVYVADNGNNIIRKITPAGVVTTIAGSRTVGYANGVGILANFNKPTGIALDATGNIYVTEPLNHAIRKINADMLVTTFTGSPTGGTVASAWLGDPNALTIDVSGNFWISDANGRILKIDTSNKMTVVAGTSGTTGATNGAGTAALFNNPTGIAAGTGGNIYVADFGNNLIRQVN